MFITFEGGEGVGKTTHVSLTSQYLETVRKDHKIPTIVKRPNSITAVGAVIRNLVLNPEFNVCKEATELLFQADLIQTEREILAPSFLKGEDVIADRWDGSAFAYPYAEGQVYEVGRHYDLLSHRYGTFQRFTPDLTFLLSFGNPIEGLKRARSSTRVEESKIDSKLLEYHLKVKKGFEDWRDFVTNLELKSISNDPRSLIEINASNSIEENQEIIENAIDKLL